MNKLNQNELSILYNNFSIYRDKYCNGHAKMSVQAFYKKYGLNNYAPS